MASENPTNSFPLLVFHWARQTGSICRSLLRIARAQIITFTENRVCSQSLASAGRYPATEQQEWSCRKARWITTIPLWHRGLDNVRSEAEGVFQTLGERLCARTPTRRAAGGGRVRCDLLSLRTFCVVSLRSPKALRPCGHLTGPLLLSESAAPGAAFEAAWWGLSKAAAFCSDPAVSWRRFHNRLAFLLAPSPLQLLSTLTQAVFSLRLAATRRPAGPGSRAAGKIGRVRSR